MSTTIPPQDYIYDEETYPNVFTCSIKHAASGQRWMFEISDRRNDHSLLVQMIQWLAATGARMVGFNNVGFDYPVLHYVLQQRPTVEEIYRFAMGIIESEDRFAYIVWGPLVPQVDLFKIHHFDNAAKSVSLKVLEFNMRRRRVVDLPFPPGTWLTSEQIDVLRAYNDDDVDATEQFYIESLPLIQFREELTVKYGRSMLNHNDGKIGKDHIVDELERRMPGLCFELGSRKPRQTWRSQIALRDVIFPWIQFKRPEFQAVHRWFAEQVITQTKGVFTDIAEERLGDMARYCTMREKKKKIGTEEDAARYPDTAYERYELRGGTKKCRNLYRHWNIADNLNVVVDGFQFDFGTGGIHGSVESRTVVSDDTHEVVDLDVASYYPNLGIVNRIYPAHLSEIFCEVYNEVYLERKQYPKGTPQNAALKLALNVPFGQSNSVYSCFYDPAYTMAITINGQLLLCLLADYLMDIPGLEMIQVNTDGLTVRLPRARRGDLTRITDWWQAHTCLELEEAVYSHMFIRDVNSYLAVYEDGKVKRKGAYEYQRQWHQNQSAMIVPMAAEAALVDGEDVRDFILNHDDIYDFMLLAKIPRGSRLVMAHGGTETPLQNVTRYYVSKTGGQLVKIMPPLAGKDQERRIGIAVGWNVTDASDIEHAVGTDINFEYYIQEAEKLVGPVKGR